MKKLILLFLLLYLSISHPFLLGAEELRNWLNDPFFQISEAYPDCPKPLGPFLSETNRLENAHHRAERGTTCWLVGKCDRPNSYLYDRDIAAALKDAFEKDRFYADSSLWVTVQGRVVYM